MEEVVRDLYVEEQNKSMIKTFNRMFLGLLVTAVIAVATYATGLYMQLPYIALAIVEIVLVIIFSLAFKKLSPTAVTLLYFAYAAVNGLTLGSIFAVYNIGTIGYAFLTTSLLFGGLALYGYTTKKDLTKLGSIFLVGLIVGLIASVINLFVGNSVVDIALNWIMLLIFCGLTVYDINRMKAMQSEVECDNTKVYVYCAMQLYLDFINIFLRLLSIFGKKE